MTVIRTLCCCIHYVPTRYDCWIVYVRSSWRVPSTMPSRTSGRSAASCMSCVRCGLRSRPTATLSSSRTWRRGTCCAFPRPTRTTSLHSSQPCSKSTYVALTITPPVEAAPVVTYLRFPVQVCFPCSDHAQPATPTSVVDTFLNSLVVLIII